MLAYCDQLGLLSMWFAYCKYNLAFLHSQISTSSQNKIQIDRRKSEMAFLVKDYVGFGYVSKGMDRVGLRIGWARWGYVIVGLG